MSSPLHLEVFNCGIGVPQGEDHSASESAVMLSLFQWTREEGLAEIVENGVQFVELPEKQKDILLLTHENVLYRLQRQLKDMQVTSRILPC